jgi:hypothetical protein
MLFGYPIAATRNNWLHECLDETLHLIHTNISVGKPLPNWPEILPERYRKRLQRRTGLKDRLNTYQIALAKLTSDERERILRAFNAQNQIDRLLSCQCDCESVNDLPPSIHNPVKDLFEFAFELLTDLEIRDSHYKEIYDSIPHHRCPFCGYEHFDAPGAYREDLDHYLLISKYSFAAANLRNLVPMGHKCNSGYKFTQDMLRKPDSKRRKSFDPYNHTIVKLSLDQSKPFAGTRGRSKEPLPKWEIDFESQSEEIETWDNVFHIRERYKRDILDAEFDSWLRIFGKLHKCKRSSSSDEDIVNAVKDYARSQELCGFAGEAFFQAAVFRMLYLQCQKGNQRLIDLIRSYVDDASVQSLTRNP